MTIDRLHIPEGEPIVPELLHPISLIDRLLEARMEQLERLQPGVYDVTPPDASGSSMKTELTVLDDGKGMVRTHITSGTGLIAATLVPSREPQTPSTKGKMIQMPSDRNRVTIIGNKLPNPKVNRIFDIILWTP